MSVRREVDRLGRVHFRSLVTGRFVPFSLPLIKKVLVEEAVFYRFTVAVNGVPVQREYHSFTLMRWYDHEPSASEKEDQKHDLLIYMESELGYGADDWWFTCMFSYGEGLQEADSLEEDYFEHHRP